MSLSITFTGGVKSVSEFINMGVVAGVGFVRPLIWQCSFLFMFSVYATRVLRDWQRLVRGSQQVFVGHFGSLISCCLLQGI